MGSTAPSNRSAAEWTCGCGERRCRAARTFSAAPVSPPDDEEEATPDGEGRTEARRGLDERTKEASWLEEGDGPRGCEVNEGRSTPRPATQEGATGRQVGRLRRVA